MTLGHNAQLLMSCNGLLASCQLKGPFSCFLSLLWNLNTHTHIHTHTHAIAFISFYSEQHSCITDNWRVQWTPPSHALFFFLVCVKKALALRHNCSSSFWGAEGWGREDGGTEKGVGDESEEGEEGVCSNRNKTKGFVTLTWGQPEGWEACHLSPFPLFECLFTEVCVC